MSVPAPVIEPAEIIRTRIGALTYLAPRSALLGDTVKPLIEVIDACCQARETKLVIDFGSVPSINSPALEGLLDCVDLVGKSGGSLKGVNASPLLQEIFTMTTISQRLELLDQTGAKPTGSGSAGYGQGRKLGEILISKGLTTTERVQEAIALQDRLGVRMGQIIVDKGWVTEAEVLKGIAEQLALPYCHLRAGLYDPAVALTLSQDVCKRLHVIPLFRIRDSLFLATSDPQSIPVFREIEDRLQCDVRPVLSPRIDIRKTIDEAYSNLGLSNVLLESLAEDFEVIEAYEPDDSAIIDQIAAESPIINTVNSIIQRAVRDRASDIHIEPTRSKTRVRFRIDGLLYEVMTLRPEMHPAIISRLKVMANLDIAEKRLPQDGRIQVHTQGRSIDLRFSSLPGLHGEKIVLRVLDKNQFILDIDQLGLAKRNLDPFKELLSRSYGLILVTGPTGSGKTTTLYAALNYLNSIEKNIVTIEDPVEYQMDIINQNPVRENVGLTFARVLKHVLRQDPDIVMVGEIREHATAEIAIQAALTGHLVLSTLHTNDSVSAITRLMDMGIEPYLLSSALIGVMAQRLVRRICPACKTSFLALPELVQRYGWHDRGQVRLSRGRGCVECYDSGYKGRLAVHELLVTDNALQQLIVSKPGRDELSAYLERRGMRMLFDDGLERVVEGKTTLEEVSRVVNA